MKMKSTKTNRETDQRTSRTTAPADLDAFLREKIDALLKVPKHMKPEKLELTITTAVLDAADILEEARLTIPGAAPGRYRRYSGRRQAK